MLLFIVCAILLIPVMLYTVINLIRFITALVLLVLNPIGLILIGGIAIAAIMFSV